MRKAPLAAAPLVMAACLALQAWSSPAAAQPVRITGRVSPAEARIELHPAHRTFEERLRGLTGGPEPASLATAAPRPDGTFEIAAPGPGFYRIVLNAEGLVPLERFLSPLLEPAALAPARLTRGAPLEVQVLGPAGTPEKGIEVRASGSAAPVVGRSEKVQAWTPAEVRGVTGEDGRVRFPRRRGDRAFVSVTTLCFVEWLEGVDGTSATLRLRQRPARVVKVLRPDGRPAPGTLVSLDASHPLGVTGADGRLALPVLDQGSPELLLEGPGGLSTTLRWPAPGSGPVTATLAPPRLVTGGVLDVLTSAPLAGALVWSQDMPPVRTGARGEFELRLPLAQQPAVAAAVAGYLTAWQPVPPSVGSEKTALLLKLAPSATLAGVAVDDGGRGPDRSRAPRLVPPHSA
ncbi:MAG TPA: hypothetical protein VEL74_21375 [Thermoanaerobaculia bacterium]|nr:hypothetical protein [Thermoanaerobaculia bacterium]